MKHIAAIIIAVIGVAFICCTAHAITSAEKESNYAAAILQLETYLETSGNSSAELAGIESTFRELGGYEQSRFLRYYVAVLMKIADEEYDFQLNTYLDMLEADGDFQKYLEDSLKRSAIKSVDKLKAYTAARKYEHEGRIADAMEEYRKCLNFFGADERYTSLMEAQYESGYERAMELLKDDDYAAAYCQFAELSGYRDSRQWMDSIVRQLGYTPSSPTDNLMPVTGLKASNIGTTEITLSWNKSNHATGYEVYYKKHNSNNWIDAGSVDKTTKKITGLEQGTSYGFKVIATIGDKVKAHEALLMNQKTVSVTPTPRPMPTPTPTLSAYELGYEYKKVSANEIAITKYTGNQATLVIPDQLNGYKVVAINGNAFLGCSSLTTVTIPNSVTRIGEDAFSICRSLISITIPTSVTSIGQYAFQGCSSLTRMIIPSSVVSISNHAFSQCTSLLSVTIPNSVTSIGQYAFSECTSLSSVTIPNSVITIDNAAFSRCSNLTSITIPDSVTKIAWDAFNVCNNLTIYGSSNTKAEEYAKKYGIPFVKQ